MAILRLFKNFSEPYRVDKSSFLYSKDVTTSGLNSGEDISGTLRDTTDQINPIFTIEYDGDFDFNYLTFFAGNIKRYYFIDKIEYVTDKLYNIHCSIDVLMTYKDIILNGIGFIDRNENTFNINIVDNKRVIETGQDIDVIRVNNNVFNYNDTRETYVVCGQFVEAGDLYVED